MNLLVRKARLEQRAWEQGKSAGHLLNQLHIPVLHIRELLYEAQISGGMLSEQLLSCSSFSVYPTKASERFEMASADVAYEKQRVNKTSALANEMDVTPARALMLSQDVTLLTAEAFYKAIKISRGYKMALETGGYLCHFYPLSPQEEKVAIASHLGEAVEVAPQGFR